VKGEFDEQEKHPEVEGLPILEVSLLSLGRSISILVLTWPLLVPQGSEFFLHSGVVG
jgi:hypothetical protein